MRISLFSASQLPVDLFERWGHLQTINPSLRSPYFRPEFTQIVGAARDDAFVAVVDDGEAFFPFHKERAGLGAGIPIGGKLSDYHGVVARPDYAWNAVELVRRAGLSGWEFDHAPASQVDLRRFALKEAESPCIELSGWETAVSRKLRGDAENRRRKLEREIGPVEFEFDCRDAEVFALCMQWKSDQYARTGLKDIMKVPWVQQVLSGIRARGDAEFSGSLSVLRAGGRPIAAHFGMRSHSAFHYWFPAYDPEMSGYSPGNLLLLAIGDAAHERGMGSIELGKGDAFYKARFANAATPLIEGFVVGDPVSAALRDTRKTLLKWLRKTPVRGALEQLADRLRNK
jgi:CelD/BcsL family acetyltransferase involved in cellulose biosynthesis